ncbi:MAG: KOW domain-containing RNA-binding protein [Bacillota bacterium]
MMDQLKPGQLVRSLAGRDKGEHYLVIAVADPGRVLVVDGRRRTMARPKKKNTAHLQRYERRVEIEELIHARKLTDSQVIRYIKELAPQEDVF